MREPCWSEAPTAYAAARDLMTVAAATYTGEPTPTGRLLAGATASGSAASSDVQNAVADVHRRVESGSGFESKATSKPECCRSERKRSHWQSWCCGYTVGRFHGKDGRPYIGTGPSRKLVKSLLRRIHARTTLRWYADEPQSTVARLSGMIRGWCGYFDQGPVVTIYDLIHRYTKRRVRRWLLRRSGRGAPRSPRSRTSIS